jgi:thiol-disulfide isomerase/thioredoxin
MSQKPAVKETKKFWTPARAALTILALSILAAFGAASCNTSEVANSTTRPTNVSSPTVRTNAQAGKSAPAPTGPVAITNDLMNRQLTTLDGHSIKLADLSGKVVVMNIWATWCGPCRKEVPEYEEVRRAFANRNIEFIGLTTEDPRAASDRVKQFARDFHFGFRLGWADRETAHVLMNGRNVIPQTFVIAADGRVLSHWRGYSPGRSGERLRDALEHALSADSGR